MALIELRYPGLHDRTDVVATLPLAHKSAAELFLLHAYDYQPVQTSKTAPGGCYRKRSCTTEVAEQPSLHSYKNICRYTQRWIAGPTRSQYYNHTTFRRSSNSTPPSTCVSPIPAPPVLGMKGAAAATSPNCNLPPLHLPTPRLIPDAAHLITSQTRSSCFSFLPSTSRLPSCACSTWN